jgi:hypothetical protein
MKIQLKQRRSTRQTTKVRMTLVKAAAAIVLITAAGLTLFLQLSQFEDGLASGDKTDLMATGPVIIKFTWNYDDVLKADVGSDARDAGPALKHKRLNEKQNMVVYPNISNKGQVMFIPYNKKYDVEGIDVSVDLSGEVNSGCLVSRDNFELKIINGYLAVAYEVDNGIGEIQSYKAKSSYRIPDDGAFRNLRFIYNPNTGKGELFVDNVIVWNHNGTPGRKLYWKPDTDIVIGKNLKGSKSTTLALDNLTIRSTAKLASMPVNLLMFSATNNPNHVVLNWITHSDPGFGTFNIERSQNGKQFVKIGQVKSEGKSAQSSTYEFIDDKPLPGICFYRISPQNFQNSSQNLPLIANKFGNSLPASASVVKPLETARQ